MTGATSAEIAAPTPPDTIPSRTGGATAGDCTEDYADGTSVTLTATATGGDSFTGWSGACTGTGACVVTMSQARSVTASFTAPIPPDAVACAIRHLAGQSCLTAAQQSLFDSLGNKDGSFNLGDLLAMLDVSGLLTAESRALIREIIP